MADIRPLLNRWPLRPDESLPSLFVRLHQVNYYKSQTAIVDVCREHLEQNDDVYLPQQADTWGIIAAITGLVPTDLYLATCHRYAAALALPSETVATLTLAGSKPLPLLTAHARRSYILPLHDAQFCPACLAEGLYHRVSWLIALAAACLQHDCLMQRGCPQCHHRLGIAAIVAGRCRRCQSDLTTAPTVDLTNNAWGLWVQQMLQSWWDDTPAPAWPVPGPVTLPDYPIPVLVEVLRGLAKAVGQGQTRESHYRRQHPSPEQLFHNYARAMKALVNWPQEFHQFLENHRYRPGLKAEWAITAEFAPLYLSWLEERWQEPEFTFVQEAFDDFLVAHYPLSRSVTRLRRYRESAALRDRFPYLTEAETAERLGVGPRLIQRLVEVGLLIDYEDGDGVQLHWHKRLKLVRRLAFVSLQERWQAGIPIDDVTRILDATPMIVGCLVNADLLTWQPATSQDTPPAKIALTSLSRLFDKLHPYPLTACTLDETVPLQQLEEGGLDVIAILQLVLGGKVDSLWFGGGLYELQVSREIWQFWQQPGPLPSPLSLST